jgi:hypothetical protein
VLWAKVQETKTVVIIYIFSKLIGCSDINIKRENFKLIKALYHDLLPEKNREAVYSLRRTIAKRLLWQFSISALKSRSMFRNMKDKHHGERCFIIGNGPSLKQTDLSLLNHEYTFGMNRIYLLFEQLGFRTTYFVSVNDYVIEQCANDISKLTMPKFINWSARQYLKSQENVIFLRRSENELSFSIDPSKYIYVGATVTYVAMQIAYYMGFKEIILIGVDHSFETKGEPGKLVTSTGGDPNHFSPNYFGLGFRWQLPDLERSEMAYSLAKEQYEKDGRIILDATVNGKLTVFPKVEFNKLFTS